MPTIIYDTETSGINTSFDQILQFAAILADDNLQELEAYSVRCRRLPHIVPSPGALLVTGMKPEEIEHQELSHFQMATEIHKRLDDWSHGGARIAGYNSLRFDEPILRQTFYQNLLPIYQTNTGGNSRIDIMRMLQACSTLAPDALVIPTDEEHLPTFRLSEVCRANSIELNFAHEATSDARATLAIARLIRERAPDIWAAMLDNADRKAIERRLAIPISALCRHYMRKSTCQPVTEAARNTFDNLEIAVFNLEYDPEPYLGANAEEWLSIINGIDSPIHILRSNSQPMLFVPELTPREVRAKWLTRSVLESRAALILSARSMRANLGHAMASRYKKGQRVGAVETRIFERFPDNQDTLQLKLFHDSGWEVRSQMLDTFHDDRFRELCTRLVYYERPDLLSNSDRTQMKAFVRFRLMTNDDVPWNTIPKALHEVTTLREFASGKSLSRLTDIEVYLRQLGDHAV